jgi:hypothetical protein
MNATRTLPDWLATQLADVPHAGQGVNLWLYRVARHLHAHMTAPEIVALLLQYTAHCGRLVTRAEVERAVANSLPHAWQPRGASAGRFSPPASKWPEPDLARIEALAKDGPGLADLWECSPLRIEDTESHAEQIIDALFPGNPLLCCGKFDYDFDTKPREDWRGELAGLQLIVPSPMSTITGMTKDGHPSKHSLSNTGPRQYVVIESDFSLFARDGVRETRYAPMIRRLTQAQGGDMPGTVADLCAAVLLHLARFGPLALAVHSGGKSLHGWFHCAGEPEDRLLRFMRYAVSLGGDDATWTKSQFVRMPDGTRDNGRRQTVYYFAPHRIKL